MAAALVDGTVTRDRGRTGAALGPLARLCVRRRDHAATELCGRHGAESRARAPRHRLRLRRTRRAAAHRGLDGVARPAAGAAAVGRSPALEPARTAAHRLGHDRVRHRSRRGDLPLRRSPRTARAPLQISRGYAMTALAISNIVLWAVVLALLLIVLALVRQLGVLHERIAPAGALMLNRGLNVGERVPLMEVEDLEGQALRVGAPRTDGKSTLLVFVSPTC